ncbi:MAG: CDP-alcohol phosphatidyltransferase family protein [Ornithinimicrobium sp.]
MNPSNPLHTQTEPADVTGYRQALHRLSAAQKTTVGAPAYSRFVNRPLGRRCAAVAFVLGLTPNGVTAMSAACSFVGIAALALVSPSWWLGLLVAFLLALGYVLDAADGQLARLRGGGSLSGEWLDHVVDAAKISSLHLAVLISTYRFLDLDPLWLLVPIAFTAVANVTFFAMILNGLLRDRHVARTGHAVVRPAPSTVRSVLVIPTDYGLLCLIFVLLGWPGLFFGAYTAIFLCSTGFLALALVKWFRDMHALGLRS